MNRNTATSTSTPRQRGAVASTVGAVVSAFVASVCCLGPLLFASLGLGGAGLLVQLEPYRPFLIVLTLALLGAGFFFTYRRPRASAPKGGACGCEHPRGRRLGRLVLWGATFLVLGLLAFPVLAPHLFG